MRRAIALIMILSLMSTGSPLAKGIDPREDRSEGSVYNSEGSQTQTEGARTDDVSRSGDPGGDPASGSLGGGSSWSMFMGNPRRTGFSPVNTTDNPGMIKWTFHPSTSFMESSPVVGSDGTIYYGRNDGEFYAVYPNGTMRWKFNTGDMIESTPAVTENGTVYIGVDNGIFYCLHPNGTLNWKISGFGLIKSSPLIADNGTIYMGLGGSVKAIDPNGSVIWSTPTGNYVSSPAMGHDGTIYIGSYDNHMYALYPNGTIKWRFETGDYISSTPVVSENDHIYFGSWDGYFYALYPNGSLKWRYYMALDPSEERFYSSATIDSEGMIIVFGPYNTNHFKFYPNGTIYYKHHGALMRGTIAVDSAGNLYYGYSSGKALYSVTKNKNFRWSIVPKGNIWGTPAIASDGTIYFVDSWGILYAIGKNASSPPSNIDSVSGDEYVNVTWDLPDDHNGPQLTGIELYRSVDGSDYTHHRSLIWNATFFNDTGLENGLNYSYYVTASNEYGESDPSLNTSAIPLGPPDPPIDISIRSGDRFAELTWSDPVDDGGLNITHFSVYRSHNRVAFNFVEKVLFNQHTYNDTDVVNGQEYFYKVKAQNPGGYSPSSVIVSTIPMTRPGVPVLEAIPGSGYVSLKWTLSDDGGSDVIMYKLYRGLGDQHAELIAEIDAENNSYNDTDVQNGITYSYYLSAVNMVGESDRTLAVAATPMGVPSPPLNLTYTYGDQWVWIDWEPPADDGGREIIGYTVYHSAYIGGDWTDVTTINTIPSYYNHTGLENGRTYSYYVAASNSIGISNVSESIEATPMWVPTSVRDLTARSGDGFVVIDWKAPANDRGSPITSYHIYRGPDQINLERIGSVDPSTLSYNDTDAVNSVDYFYSVTAENGEGESDQALSVIGSPRKVTTAPTTPGDLKVEYVDNGVKVSWSPPDENGGSPITGYFVERVDSKGSVREFVFDNNTTSFTDDEVVGGMTYTYRVYADNEKGRSLGSDPVDVEIPEEKNGDEKNLLWLWIGIGVIVLILIIIMIVFFLIGRRKETEEPELPVE